MAASIGPFPVPCRPEWPLFRHLSHCRSLPSLVLHMQRWILHTDAMEMRLQGRLSGHVRWGQRVRWVPNVSPDPCKSGWNPGIHKSCRTPAGDISRRWLLYYWFDCLVGTLFGHSPCVRPNDRWAGLKIHRKYMAQSTGPIHRLSVANAISCRTIFGRQIRKLKACHGP